jgi:hypothetical protein
MWREDEADLVTHLSYYATGHTIGRPYKQTIKAAHHHELQGHAWAAACGSPWFLWKTMYSGHSSNRLQTKSGGVSRLILKVGQAQLTHQLALPLAIRSTT